MNSFLTNTSEITFLNQIKDNLKRCDSFCFSVSFIKKAGLVLLYKELESAMQRGCKGKLTNPRKQEKHQTYLFDIEMEEVLPDYLQYDFGLTRMN